MGGWEGFTLSPRRWGICEKGREQRGGIARFGTNFFVGSHSLKIWLHTPVKRDAIVQFSQG